MLSKNGTVKHAHWQLSMHTGSWYSVSFKKWKGKISYNCEV